MGVFQTKAFVRFARKAGIGRDQLLGAAHEVAEGKFDADLGGGVFKQRVARRGKGKSGGFRAILFFRAGGHVFLVHGFGKNEKANVSARELDALKTLADTYLNLSEGDLASMLADGAFAELEMNHDDE